MKARAAVVIILAVFNLMPEGHAKKKLLAQVKDGIVALDNKVATLATEQTSKLSKVEQQLTSLANQLTTFIENNKCCAQEEEQSCPPEWHVFGSSCYHLFDEKKTWDDAMKFCKALGGYLAEVANEDEDKFIFSLFHGKSGRGPWIGGHDRQTEGRWFWYNSGNTMSYTNWNAGEPNGRTKENCVHYWSYSGRVWNDAPCYVVTTSICEMSK